MKLSGFNRYMALAALALTAFGASARQLTPDEAIAALGSSRAKAPAAVRGSLKLAHTFTAADDKAFNTLYVFNRAAADGGFVILSADDVACPVLGYSDSGEFSVTDMPENLRAWLDTYSSQIAAAAAAGGRVFAAPADGSLASIEPIVSTHWNQDYPFNAMTPKVGNDYCVTGCVATAIAQVINKHRWPDTGVGSVSYKWNNKTLSYDYTKPFDWDNMLDDYTDGGANASQAQIDAVAQLMYACGVAANMNYGTDASGATSEELVPNLISKFRYDKSLILAPRDFFGLAEWTRMLHADLSAGRPVYYTASTIRGEGHAFVLDGYRADDGFFHVNWGWGGMSDGYYAVTELDPISQGIGGASAGFSQNQSALFGLKKAVPGSRYTPLFVSYGFGTERASYSTAQDVAFTLGGILMNYSVTTVPMDFGVKLVNTAGGAVSYAWWDYEAQDVPRGHGFQSALDIKGTKFPTSGVYDVTPVVRVNGEISDVHVHAAANPSLKLTCTGSRLEFTSTVPSAYLLPVNITQSVFAPGREARLEVEIENTGGLEYFNMPLLCGFLYGTQAFQFPNLVGNIGSGETRKYTFSGVLPEDVPAGKYDLVLVYFNNEYDQLRMDTKGFKVEVGEPLPDAKLKLVSVDFPDAVSGKGSSLRPYTVTVDPLRFDIEVSAEESDFDGYVGAYLLSADSRNQYTEAHQGSFMLTNGATRKFSFTQDWASYFSGAEKLLLVPFSGTLDGSTIKATPISTGIYLSDATAGISDADIVSEFAVFPNPASDIVCVEAPAPLREVAVYTLGGSLACSQTFDGTSCRATLPVESLAPGMYVLRAATSAGHHTFRLIKN